MLSTQDFINVQVFGLAQLFNDLNEFEFSRHSLWTNHILPKSRQLIWRF